MGNRTVESLKSLTGQGSSASVAYGGGYYQRERIAELAESIYGSLGVKRVEAGLQKYQVGSSAHECIHLFAVGGHEIIEIKFPGGRIIGIRRQGEGLAGWSAAAGHVNFPWRRIRNPPGQSGSLERHIHGFVALCFRQDPGRGSGCGPGCGPGRGSGIVGLTAYPIGIETVGGNNIGPCLYILSQYLFLAEPSLEHSAHSTVQNKNTAFQIIQKCHRLEILFENLRHIVRSAHSVEVNGPDSVSEQVGALGAAPLETNTVAGLPVIPVKRQLFHKILWDIDGK